MSPHTLPIYETAANTRGGKMSPNALSIYETAADTSGYIYFAKAVCREQWSLRPHFHDSVEITVVTKGTCHVRINAKEELLQPGTILFVDRFDVHDYHPDLGNEYYVVLVSSEYLDATNGLLKKTLPTFLRRPDAYETIKAFLEYAYPLWENSNETFRIGFVNTLLGLLTRYYDLCERDIKHDARVMTKALKYINQNFSEEITLDILVEKFGYTKTYFSTLFKKFTGMNLREYINRRRISEFERIISQDPGMSIYKASMLCGYRSPNTFYRAYSKYKHQ